MAGSNGDPNASIAGAGKSGQQAFSTGTGLSKRTGPRVKPKTTQANQKRTKKSKTAKDSLVATSNRRSLFSTGRPNSTME